ncbi:hypothetical protein TRFO_15281 [Tritrichomonas foetus]|uniref:Uncharacterized protein n=1 Tax=Tritrichomonas foetus TaxID=1144522 RepID=A0A1J4KSX7_9EUKA|nr:hypothetical protein TRFO_15281 [Tritrichomonas foetus]|eukprot:OHT14363.1 hypothetical protein TRFO_15281 [Tritrichomonas foetus]
MTAFIDKSNDPSYLSGYLTPVINEVNEKVVKVAKFVKNIESCFRHIQSTRLEYLKKQFIYLEEIEKKDIESAFNDDDQLWLNVIADTKNKLKSAYDTSSSLFPGNCYNQIAALPEQFLSIRSELFQPVSMPAPRNNDMLSKQREYRCNLLALNSLLKRLKLLCFDTHNMITTFSEGIITLLDKVEQILEQLRDLVVREQQLNFDFQKKHPDIEPPPKEVIKALDEKRMQLELDMAFLKLEKENFQSISINILRLVRHCIN